MKKIIKNCTKVISLMLAVMFAFSAFLVPAYAKESDNTAYIKLTSDKASPKPGETFTVTVSAKTNYPVINVNTIIVYDSNYYQLDTSSGAAVKKVTKMPVGMNGATNSPLGMYHQSYSSDMTKRYKLVFNAITWLPSLAPQGTSTPTTTLSDYEKLYTIKFKMKSGAPTDGNGFLGIDPVYLKTETSNMRSGVYASRGGATLKEGAVAACGQTIDLSEAVLFGKEVIKSEADYKVTVNYKSTLDIEEVMSIKNDAEYLSADTSIVSTDGDIIKGVKRGTTYVAGVSSDGKTRANCEVEVKYSLLQWFIVIFLFGWLWY